MNWLEKITYRLNIVLFRLSSGKARIRLARQLGVRIGSNCELYYCNLSTEPYLISIGNNCKITYGVTFMTHDGAKWVLEQKGDFEGSKFGPIVIRDNSFIGVNAIIMPDTVIGPNSVVGAGSVVTKDVPPNTVYAGNPARFICTYEEYLEKCRLKNTGSIPRRELKAVLTSMFKRELEQSEESPAEHALEAQKPPL
jgi:acetyltransferase-like isoleucine patch superfamily enzyme